MPTKAELQEGQNLYYAYLRQAQAAVVAHDWPVALTAAKQALHFVDLMMQFERKYQGKEFETLEAIDIVLDTAPFLLDHASLEQVRELLKTQKRIDKNASADLMGAVNEACDILSRAHMLWREATTAVDGIAPIEDCDGMPLRLAVRWRTLQERWESLGVLCRASNGANSGFRVQSPVEET